MSGGVETCFEVDEGGPSFCCLLREVPPHQIQMPPQVPKIEDVTSQE